MTDFFFEMAWLKQEYLKRTDYFRVNVRSSLVRCYTVLYVLQGFLKETSFSEKPLVLLLSGPDHNTFSTSRQYALSFHLIQYR